MNTMHKGLIIALVAASISGVASAAENSTKEEAIAFMAKAQAYMKANGLEKATAEFNNSDGPFNSKSDINPKGDLYIFSVDKVGLQAIHKNPKIRGKNNMELRVNGVYLIKELAAACYSKEGKGWVNYPWPHPVTKELEQKVGYVEKVPGQDLCLGTGIYK